MVRLSCGVQCTRASLFALNIVFLLVGCSVMGLGIYVKVNGNFKAISEVYTISEALGRGTMQWIAVGMIVAGIFTALLATFGCLGAILQNRCCLYIYSLLLTLIIVFEFVAVIATLVYRDNLWKTYDSGFMDVFQDAYCHNQTDAIEIIESIERKFKCCGVEGPIDYALCPKMKIPLSCHPNQNSTLPSYPTGCAPAIAIWIWDELPIIAGVLGAVLLSKSSALFQLLYLAWLYPTHQQKMIIKNFNKTISCFLLSNK